jgi:hypothetical protein
LNSSGLRERLIEYRHRQTEDVLRAELE